MERIYGGALERRERERKRREGLKEDRGVGERDYESIWERSDINGLSHVWL